jgi:tetratricopeptide (TPR) repeat protein
MLAEEALAAGRPEEARERFRVLAERASVPADVHDAKLREGDASERLGDLDGAARAWLDALAVARTREQAAVASLRIARALAGEAKTRRDGLTALLRVALHFPQTVSGVRALDWILAVADVGESGDASALAFFRALRARVRGTALEAQLVLRQARLLAEIPEDGARYEALALARELIRRWPRSGLVDDATFLAAMIQRDLGHHGEALRTLDEILSWREPAYLLGNYETRFYVRGMWAKAELLEFQMERPELAARTYGEFARAFPFSSRYPEALFRKAALERALGREGDARATWEQLVRDRPETALARRARALLATGSDPGDPPPWSRPARLGEEAP